MPVQIYDEIEQSSPEWFECRRGLPTASMFSAILAKGEGKTRRSYMLKLAGEILTGKPGESFSSPEMERGKAMEKEARDLYAFLHSCEPRQVGFIRNGAKGCSPDSLIGCDGGLEIKTKRADLLIDVILADKVPTEHVAQLQGFLWIAEREWIDFVAYWPSLPLFKKRVFRDEAYILTLSKAVEQFNADLADVVETIRARGEAA